ncbi:hypothetical protein AAFF_G00061010 [Aldrovandia affinis]|uniref:G2 and S phase-expressed protein 1 N-terminal domain-containing protein n=1 Tax=Aldrovandia affinis TaxID=143900 RepID=A0AAD7RZU9_9TELE|nr:hypothetical protein AAFF_G00061010 [Aldrovandia affinis]
MASPIINDFVCLAEERFDFDLPPSPASEKGDEEEMDDEVFVGSFSHKEKCISVGIESTLKEVSSASSMSVLSLELGSWSPLSGDKFDQIIQEAHMVAREIGKNGNGGSKQAARQEDADTAAQDEEADLFFTEDPRAKLSALTQPPAPSLSPIKRETFCVQDSPMKQLPPAIQQRLLKAGGVTNPSAAQARNASLRKATPCPAQPKGPPRGKGALSSGRVVLPSRPTVPGVTQPSAKMRLPPPDKRRTVQKRSPSGRPVSRAESSEDLLSDTASIASDVSDSSLNTSLPGKRGLPALSKVGLRAPPVMKAPPLPGRPIVNRRKNTTSSSSSASSLNSSLTVTPSGKGKFNTSLSSGASGAKPRGPASLSQLPNSGAASTKPQALSASSRALEPMRAGRLTLAAQGKKPTEPQARPGRSTPLKKPEPAPSNRTPAQRPRRGQVPIPASPPLSPSPW